MDYRIIEFEERHIAGIVNIENQCFSSPWTEEEIREASENPAYRFLVAESGVFLNASRQRLSPLRMFDLGGEWIADVDADYSQRPEDTTIASVSASVGLNRFFVLNTDGTVDVWEAR